MVTVFSWFSVGFGVLLASYSLTTKTRLVSPAMLTRDYHFFRVYASGIVIRVYTFVFPFDAKTKSFF